VTVEEDVDPPSGLMREPDATGRFGEFGGRFVPETLVPACIDLEREFRDAWADPAFRKELETQSTRRCGTGAPPSATPTTASVR
jgi:tryptophan synthase beta chain